MEREYPGGYVMRIQILDGLMFLVGLCLLATPGVLGFFPGALDTTVHVTLGSLICVCAVFRVLVAYGSAWVEVVLCSLGVITFFLPWFMSMRWVHAYSADHFAAGGAVILLSVVSAMATFAELRKGARTG